KPPRLVRKPPRKRGAARSLPVYWPTYGFEASRVRWAESPLRPPFRRVWTFRARALLEFPPVVGYGRLYFANNHGVVYALNAETGATDWSFATGGKIKGAVALEGGRVYVGSYDHHVYALDADTGKLLWKAKAQDRFGYKTGTFYATPAVAYGRVYI